MAGNDLVITLVSCMVFMALVAWISYLKTRGEVSTRDGYFLAGRGLGAVFIGGGVQLFQLIAQ